jgi:hypothetical protein
MEIPRILLEVGTEFLNIICKDFMLQGSNITLVQFLFEVIARRNVSVCY